MTGPRLSRGPDPARPRRSIFKELLFSMLAFGTVVGLMFPLFAQVQLHSKEAMTYRFFALCVCSGLIIGVGNFLIFKMVVSWQLSRLVAGMQHVNDEVRTAKDSGEGTRETYTLTVTSNDLIGDVAASFNHMTAAIRRRITVESTTRKLLATLSATAEESVVSREILEAIAAICGAKAGVLYGDTGQKFKMLSSFGVDLVECLPEEIGASQGLAQRALARGEVLCASPSRDGFEWMELSTPLGGFRPGAVALVPLMAEQRAVGLAAMACTSDHLTDEQTSLLDSVRTQAAPYLHTAILHEKLRNLAAIDDLTRILNRRFGMRRLAEEFSRSARHGLPLSVIMIDIDRFKAFNDTFGHDAGDAVLVSVARVLENSVRAGDVVCRYGGEEIMIVAPGMGMNDAGAVAERLRRLVEVTATIWRDQSLNVTISLGTASWPIIRASMPEEMVTYADEALYHAKRSGRNRVSVHQGKDVIPASMLDVSAQ